MKRVAAILWMMCAVAYAQVEVNYLYGSQQNNTVKLSWEISKGSICNGIEIQRADDGLLFVTIGEIDGICGSTDYAQQFEFIDESPINFSMNHYRLVAGGALLNDTVSVRFNNVIGDFFISNPITNESVLYLGNEGVYNVSILDLTGKTLVQKTIYSSFIYVGDIHCCLSSATFILKISSENGNSSVQKLIKTD